MYIKKLMMKEKKNIYIYINFILYLTYIHSFIIINHII